MFFNKKKSKIKYPAPKYKNKILIIYLLTTLITTGVAWSKADKAIKEYKQNTKYQTGIDDNILRIQGALKSLGVDEYPQEIILDLSKMEVIEYPKVQTALNIFKNMRTQIKKSKLELGKNMSNNDISNIEKEIWALRRLGFIQVAKLLESALQEQGVQITFI